MRFICQRHLHKLSFYFQTWLKPAGTDFLKSFPRFSDFIFRYFVRKFCHLLILFPFFFEFSAGAFTQSTVQFSHESLKLYDGAIINGFGLESFTIEHGESFIYHVGKIIPDLHSSLQSGLQNSENASQQSTTNHKNSIPHRFAHIGFWFLCGVVWTVSFFIGRWIDFRLNRRKNKSILQS